MRFGVKIDTNINVTIIIELSDYTEHLTDLIDAMMWNSDIYFDITRLIQKGVNCILKKEDIENWTVTNRQIIALREDEFADYQLYIDTDFDKYTVYKVHFDLEEIERDCRN